MIQANENKSVWDKIKKNPQNILGSIASGRSTTESIALAKISIGEWQPLKFLGMRAWLLKCMDWNRRKIQTRIMTCNNGKLSSSSLLFHSHDKINRTQIDNVVKKRRGGRGVDVILFFNDGSHKKSISSWTFGISNLRIAVHKLLPCIKAPRLFLSNFAAYL